VGFAGLGRLDVTQRTSKPLVVAPRHPFQGPQLDGLARPAGRPAVDELGFAQTDDPLGQRVGVTAAAAAHRGLDAGLGEQLRNL
jgi:hypothetical protein